MDLFQTELEGSAPGLAAVQTERRTLPRFSWQGTAVIRILPCGPEVLGALLDISECGCGVELGIAIPAQVGAQVEVDLNVHGVRLKRTGIIRHIAVIRRIEKETRAGIEFVAVNGRRGEPVECSAEGLFRRL